jgi:hypothetical protein
MIDWNRDITWPADEHNPPDAWVPEYAIDRFAERWANAPERGLGARRERKRVPYKGVPVAPLAARVREKVAREGITINDAMRQINSVSGRCMGHSTLNSLLNETYSCVSHKTAQAVDLWLQDGQNG